MAIPPSRLSLWHRSSPCETTLSLNLPILSSLLLTPSLHYNPSVTFLPYAIFSCTTQTTTSFFPLHQFPFTPSPNTLFTPLVTLSLLQPLSNNPPKRKFPHQGWTYDIVTPPCTATHLLLPILPSLLLTPSPHYNFIWTTLITLTPSTVAQSTGLISPPSLTSLTTVTIVKSFNLADYDFSLTLKRSLNKTRIVSFLGLTYKHTHSDSRNVEFSLDCLEKGVSCWHVDMIILVARW